MHTENLRDYSQLRRSLTDRKVAGVAGGLGRHLNIDPTILRVAFVVLCFFGGAGFVLYGAAWLLVPEEGRAEGQIATSPSTRNVLLLGAAVIAGCLLVGDSWGGFWFPWPLAIVALVVFAVLMNRDKPMNTTTMPPVGEPGTEPTTEYGAEPPPPPWMPPTQQAYQPPVPSRDRGPKLFWITLALVAIALGVLGLYDVSGGSVVASAYPALGLTVVGAMLVLGAWVGRAGGLIFLGIVAAIALAISSVAVNTDFDGDRRIDETPSSAAQVRDRYDIPAGGIRLDLSQVRDLDALDGRTIDLEANAGEIVVIVPDGTDVDVDADVSVAGEASVFGHEENGPDVHVARTLSGGVDAPQLELDIQLLVGSIEVRQS
ncbi:MAG TPA: PspC domain-containing protein [Nocardioidaceae bacterium]|nr:PspC domain-containing protein [Nocardioidaceae bacterium]